MSRDRWRARLEDGLKLELNKLIHDGVLRPGFDCQASIRWTRTNTGDEVASVTVASFMRGESYGRIELEMEGRRQEIALESLPRHFGGRQWYFICPSRHCLVSVLWRPYGAIAFASRQAWGRRAAYASQFETPYGRAISRAQSLRCRLGGPEFRSLLSGTIPPKPKGMQWRTYEQKIQEINRAENICNQNLALFIERFRR